MSKSLNSQQRAKALDLLRRFGVSDSTIDLCRDSRSIAVAMCVVADIWDDKPVPDKEWLRNWFDITGEHMILTEEGWEPGSHKASYLADDPTWEPIEEVNSPARVI